MTERWGNGQEMLDGPDVPPLLRLAASVALAMLVAVLIAAALLG